MDNISKDIKEQIESTLVWKYDWLQWKTNDAKLYLTNYQRQQEFDKFFEPWIKWNKEILSLKEDEYTQLNVKYDLMAGVDVEKRAITK